MNHPPTHPPHQQQHTHNKRKKKKKGELCHQFPWHFLLWADSEDSSQINKANSSQTNASLSFPLFTTFFSRLIKRHKLRKEHAVLIITKSPQFSFSCHLINLNEVGEILIEATYRNQLRNNGSQ